VHIWTRTGRKPLIAGGNAVAEAAERSWTVVSMRDDFLTVF
jgi:hypothetical protein